MMDAGRSFRIQNYTVTEEQANRQYYLVEKEFTPGQVMAKLLECTVGAYNVTPEADTPLIGWKPMPKS